MTREFGLEHVVRDPSSVVTVGTFDGVHAGHQVILDYLKERASELGGRSTVISFSPHPRTVVHGETVPLLTTVEERAAVFETLGIDRFIVIEFTPAFSQLGAEAFVRQVLVDQVGLREIVVGYDHGFGRGRAGDHDLLERLGDELGFTVDLIPVQVVEKHVVSSSEIRRQLTEHGDVGLAAELLGRFYTLMGTVVEGDRRGRQIGFPTANLQVEQPEKVVPKRGVYAVRVRRPATGEVHGGMMNIGQRPTFDGQELRLEVHLFEVDADLYGESLEVAFVQRVRDEQKFNGVDALREQLSRDRDRCTAALRAVSSTAFS